MANETKNIFISHIHEDDEGLGKLKSLLKDNGMTTRDYSINADNPNNAHSEDYIKSQILAPRIHRTVFPRLGKRVWYDDQLQVHNQIFESREAVDYAFMGTNPDAADNRWLREAFENRVPVIYFLGVAPGLYQAIIPTYISGWDANALKARIVFGIQDQTDYVAPESVSERRYALHTVKQRLHQASFREAVITAYNGRCALSGLPEQRLLDAAHIISDKDERLGQPVVPNGLPLSKIHHAAFDAHLIGIDPDYRLHVSGRLLDQHDGPMLEALKQLDGGMLHLPTRTKDYPDRDRLSLRYEQFRVAA